VHLGRIVAPVLGTVLVACTASGVVGVHLGEDEARLRRDLDRRFPGAVVKRPSGFSTEVMRVLRAYLQGGPWPGDVPVVLPEGTFASRVWRQLRRIPPGQVRTYARVAQALRRRGAARAVGQACGCNPVPLFVPCHRVVAADLRLGGFTGGTQVKRHLLALEGVTHLA